MDEKNELSPLNNHSRGRSSYWDVMRNILTFDWVFPLIFRSNGMREIDQADSLSRRDEVKYDIKEAPSNKVISIPRLLSDSRFTLFARVSDLDAKEGLNVRRTWAGNINVSYTMISWLYAAYGFYREGETWLNPVLWVPNEEIRKGLGEKLVAAIAGANDVVAWIKNLDAPFGSFFMRYGWGISLVFGIIQFSLDCHFRHKRARDRIINAIGGEGYASLNWCSRNYIISFFSTEEGVLDLPRILSFGCLLFNILGCQGLINYVDSCREDSPFFQAALARVQKKEPYENEIIQHLWAFSEVNAENNATSWIVSGLAVFGVGRLYNFICEWAAGYRLYLGNESEGEEQYSDRELEGVGLRV